MIHIATVHYKSAQWIDIQRKYLKKNITSAYRLYACLNRIENKHHEKFYYSVEIEGTHADKLNYLAGVILEEANDDDLILFLDGDAFPISQQIISVLREKFKVYKMIAIKREENLGDIQPSPIFCATTAGFWKSIGGDWRKGYQWKNSRGGLVTDVGGICLCNKKRTSL